MDDFPLMPKRKQPQEPSSNPHYSEQRGREESRDSNPDSRYRSSSSYSEQNRSNYHQSSHSSGDRYRSQSSAGRHGDSRHGDSRSSYGGGERSYQSDRSYGGGGQDRGDGDRRQGGGGYGRGGYGGGGYGGRGGYGKPMDAVAQAAVQKEVDDTYGKQFAFRFSSSQKSQLVLPPPEAFFSSAPFAVPELMQIKSELDETRNKLDQLDWVTWHAHTRSTNRAGFVVNDLRKQKAPEMCTIAWAKMYEMAYKLTFEVEKNRVPLVRFPPPPELLSYEDVDGKKVPALYTMHICEAPGAFICATNHFLQTKIRPQSGQLPWKWMGVSLNPYFEKNNLEAMIDDDRFILESRDSWYFGPYDDGNIMDATTLRGIGHEISRRKFGRVSLITADGSIDCAEDPNEQEATVAQLHYCETVCAIAHLAPGGAFILKAFNLLEHTSVCLLYLMLCCFESVDLIKPSGSKPGNSEIYISGSGYKGIGNDHLAALMAKYSPANPDTALFPMSSIPKFALDAIVAGSRFFADIQRGIIEENITLFSNFTAEQKSLRQTVRMRVASTYMDRFQVDRMDRRFNISSVFLDGRENNLGSAVKAHDSRKKNDHRSLDERKADVQKRKDRFEMDFEAHAASSAAAAPSSSSAIAASSAAAADVEQQGSEVDEVSESKRQKQSAEDIIPNIAFEDRVGRSAEDVAMADQASASAPGDKLEVSSFAKKQMEKMGYQFGQESSEKEIAARAPFDAQYSHSGRSGLQVQGRPDKDAAILPFGHSHDWFDDPALQLSAWATSASSSSASSSSSSSSSSTYSGMKKGTPTFVSSSESLPVEAARASSSSEASAEDVNARIAMWLSRPFARGHPISAISNSRFCSQEAVIELTHLLHDCRVLSRPILLSASMSHFSNFHAMMDRIRSKSGSALESCDFGDMIQFNGLLQSVPELVRFLSASEPMEAAKTCAVISSSSGFFDSLRAHVSPHSVLRLAPIEIDPKNSQSFEEARDSVIFALSSNASSSSSPSGHVDMLVYDICPPRLLNLASFTLLPESLPEDSPFLFPGGMECASRASLLQAASVALTSLRRGGRLVIRSFEIWSRFSVSIIYILRLCFKRLAVVCPPSCSPLSPTAFLIFEDFVGSDCAQARALSSFITTDFIPKYTAAQVDGVDLLEPLPINYLFSDRNLWLYLANCNSMLAKRRSQFIHLIVEHFSATAASVQAQSFSSADDVPSFFRQLETEILASLGGH